jgi:hypothetical protein
MDTVIPLPGTFTVARLPTVADVDAIVATEDPCVRNLRITHTYHRLASAFAAASPGPGASWCVFATWASKQAGQTIRGEDVLQAMQRALDTPPRVEAALDGMFRRAVRLAFGRHGSKRKQILRILGTDAFHRASAAVGAGNLKVFAEIGREFARFLPLCTGGRVDPRALDAFLAGLRPGDPPEGQEYLRRAFTHYAQAMEAADPRDRAELLLLANLEIGWHEQTRLQPEILASLEVPFETATGLGRRILLVLAPGSAHWWAWAGTAAAGVLGVFGRLSEKTIRPVLRRAVTESLMTLRLPGGTIRLGRAPGVQPPESLRDPRHPELVALLARIQPAPGDADGAGADDWSVLEERMLLIGTLFRCQHEDRSLLGAPFAPEQVREFEAGRVPGGVL